MVTSNLPGACADHIKNRPVASITQAREWVAEFGALRSFPMAAADFAATLTDHPAICCRRGAYAQSLVLDAIGEYFGAPLPSSLGARHDASYPLSARDCTNPACWLPVDHKSPCDTSTPGVVESPDACPEHAVMAPNLLIADIDAARRTVATLPPSILPDLAQALSMPMGRPTCCTAASLARSLILDAIGQHYGTGEFCIFCCTNAVRYPLHPAEVTTCPTCKSTFHANGDQDIRGDDSDDETLAEQARYEREEYLGETRDDAANYQDGPCGDIS